MQQVINPFDQSVVGEVQYDTLDTIKAKIATAKAFIPAEATDDLEERLEAMARFRTRFQDDIEKAASLLASQTGKPVSQARGEIQASDARIAYFMEQVPALIQATTVTEGATQEEKSYQPLGVVANISAWNYPFFIGLNVIVPALLAGNAVLYKASEFCPLTAELIAEQLWDSGFSRDQFILVQGGGKEGQMLLEQDINGVFFTGSSATGTAIAKQMAGRMVKVQMELGGKDPSYVTENVDVKAVAQGLADGAFYNAGQSCCAVERIYVHQSIAEEFISHFKAEVECFKFGDPQDDSTYLGPLTRAAQIEVLQAQVQDAVEKGATVICGGEADARTGFFQPTVLTHVNHGMSVMQEESFGPIIGIMTVESDEEAQRLMADTEYGLTAGVFCQDQQRARDILKPLKTGTAYINVCDRVSPYVPWTGRKQSGLGSTLGHEGVFAFVHPRSWQIR
ncbi:MAG: aldehyde dehydrogenase [Gammaproteobacteria bacterium]|nr:aldehyde dehydrogenase [Gammaproteobacteria bacterium]HBF07867.1 aldehyde dehydrogenase [Gammaproteobacteria bacterium]|tara:strand:+ start:184 stop:1539 length:1356 start_codon:yes stop_codon:yes gene_type:complete